MEAFGKIYSERKSLPVPYGTRLPGSFVATYALLCGEARREYSAGIEKRLLEIGKSAFRRPDFYQETLDVLKSLKENGYSLVLWTQGEVGPKRAKLDSLGVEFNGLFDIEILAEEKENYPLEELARGCEYCAVVGNSPENDIAPARRAGLSTYLIDRYGKTDNPFPDTIEISSLSELVFGPKRAPA